MLTAYFRIKQEGIEPLKKGRLRQNKETSHYYFDHFRGGKKIKI
jgi:hypothetical protein